MPQTGRNAQNLVLAEDQKEFQQGQSRSRKQRMSENIFDPDAALAFTGSAARYGGTNQPVVGYGRRNPNETNGRKRS